MRHISRFLPLLLLFLLAMLWACTPSTPQTATPITDTLTATPSILPSTTDTPTHTPSQTPIIPTSTPIVPSQSRFAPSPTPTTPPTPTQEPLPPGLLFGISEDRFLVDLNGQAQPLGDYEAVSPNGRTLFRKSNIFLDFSDPALTGEGYLFDTVTQEEIQLPLGPLFDVALANWWPAEPDWVLLNVTHNADLWSAYYGPVQTGVARVDGTEYRFLPGQDDSTSWTLPAPAPQGRLIAYDSGGRGYIYDLENNTVVLIDPADVDPQLADVSLIGPSWSPDGQLIVWGVAGSSPGGGTGDPYGIMIWDMETQTGLYREGFNVVLGDEGWRGTPKWSPDGARLLFQSPYLEGYGAVMTDREGNVLTFREGVEDPRWLNEEWIAYEYYGQGRWVAENLESGDLIDIPPPPFAWLNETLEIMGGNFGVSGNQPQRVSLQTGQRTVLPLPENSYVLDQINLQPTAPSPPPLEFTTALNIHGDDENPITTTDLQIVNDRVYVTRGHELLVLDAENPQNILGRLAFGQRFGEESLRMFEYYYFSPLRLAVTEDGTAIISDDQLYVVDVRNPENMAVIGTAEATGRYIRVLDGIAYLNDTLNLRLVDVANPSDPQLLADYTVYEDGDFGSYLVDFEVVSINDRRLVIFAGQSRGLVMLDVTDPVKIERLPGVPDLWVSAVTAVGTRLYVQGEPLSEIVPPPTKLYLYDIADPQQPQMIAEPLAKFGSRELLLTADNRFFATALGYENGENQLYLLWGSVGENQQLQPAGEVPLNYEMRYSGDSLALYQDQLFLGGGHSIMVIKGVP